MRLKLVTEFLSHRNDGHCRRIAQRTERTSKHVLGEVLHVVDVLAQATACMEADQRFLQPIGSFTAGDTPSAAFVLIELRGSQSVSHDTGLIIENDYATRPEERASLLQRVEVHRQIEFVRG